MNVIKNRQIIIECYDLYLDSYIVNNIFNCNSIFSGNNYIQNSTFTSPVVTDKKSRFINCTFNKGVTLNNYEVNRRQKDSN